MSSQTTPANPSRKRPLPILLLGALILLPVGLFILLFSTTPGDDTQLSYSLPPSPKGLRIESRSASPEAHLTETYLLAINDQPVSELLVNLLHDPFTAPDQTPQEMLNYLLSDTDSAQVIPVLLETAPLGAVILQDWSFYLSFVLLLTIGLIVILRRPQLNASRTYFLLSCLIVSSGTVFFIGLRASDLRQGLIFWLWMWSVIPLYGLLVGAVMHFALVFPEPRSIVKEHPSILVLAYLVVWVPYLALVLLIWPSVPTPAQRIQVILEGTGVMTLTGFLLAIAIASGSYFISFNNRQRRQSRWVIWGTLVASLPWLAVTVLPGLLGQPAPDLAIIGVLWWAIPISFAIAILRENLFDIDTLINRTIVYLVLSLLLAIIYFAIVTLLQGLLTTVTDQQSTIAIVISTLAIAALFNPLRGRIQNLIDRRFYRQKYNTEKALATFGVTVRDEVDLENISKALLAVVEETMQPESVSVWLRE